MSFGRLLRDARLKAGLTQAELAGRTGIGQTGITRIESGQQEASVAQLCALAAALNVTAASLLGEVELPDVVVVPTYEVRCVDHGLVVTLDSVAAAQEHRQRHARTHLRGRR